MTRSMSMTENETGRIRLLMDMIKYIHKFFFIPDDYSFVSWGVFRGTFFRATLCS